METYGELMEGRNNPNLLCLFVVEDLEYLPYKCESVRLDDNFQENVQ